MNKKPSKRLVDILDDQPLDLVFWNKMFGRMEILLKLIEACKPNHNIDDPEIRWVEDRIEYFNANERLLNKGEMQIANDLWKKYGGSHNVKRSIR